MKLIEVCNLANAKDRTLMRTKAYRQKVAESVYEGLVNFYKDRDGAPVVAASR